MSVPQQRSVHVDSSDTSRTGPQSSMLQGNQRNVDQLDEVQQFLLACAPETSAECLLSWNVTKNVLFMESLGEVAQKFMLFTGSQANYNEISDGRRTWSSSNITKEKHAISVQL